MQLIITIICVEVLKLKMKKWGRPKQEQNESRLMGHWIADEVKITTDRGFCK